MMGYWWNGKHGKCFYTTFKCYGWDIFKNRLPNMFLLEMKAKDDVYFIEHKYDKIFMEKSLRRDVFF